MASLYRKKKSPFWWVAFYDAKGKRQNESTGLRADSPGDTAKARVLRAELEAKELRREAAAVGESWDSWVSKFLDRHCNTEKTLERYHDAWKWVAMWLQYRHIHTPKQITYKTALEYIDWRINFKKKSGKKAGRNTAILELKTFSLILSEAVRLGHADSNPLVHLRIRKDKAKKKPELTDEEIVLIRRALKSEPEWMQVAFEIGLNTGCRLREAIIPMSCIDFVEEKITFPSPKGGEDRAFSIPMPDALKPLFERLKAERRTVTLQFPFQPSRRWTQFFAKIKTPHLCFHCLRVTFVNRLRRAGVPREAAMRLVNHASELIHQIYQREKVSDVAQWRNAVSFPS